MTKKIFLLAILSLAGNQLYADATSDLFTAIEVGDVKKVEAAIAAGADLETPRTSDNLSPKLLAEVEFLKVFRKIGKPVSFGSLCLSALASCALPISAYMHNKKYGLIGLAGTALYATPIDNMTKNPKIENAINFFQLASLTAGIGTLLATAWQSNNTILNTIGTAGLAYFIGYVCKFGKEINNRQKINSILNSDNPISEKTIAYLINLKKANK